MRKVSLLFATLALGVMSLTAVQAQDKVIKIASQSPLSGPQSSLGIGISNGVALAIEQLSGPLTEAGFTVEYVPFDDEATPDKGVSNAQQIVADPAILGVVGHLNSGVAIPSSEVYNDSDLVMVSPANTNPTVTDRGYLTVNRICGRDDLQGPTGAQYAFDQGVTSVYILDDTTAYGVGIADFFQAKAEELGVVVLGRQGTAEVANFDSLITPILALAPEMIYFGGIFNQTAVFISQVRAAGFEGLIMGGDGFDSADFAALAGDAGVGTLYTSTAGPASLFENAAQFIEDYTAKYGEAPRPYATEAYDSAAIILKAIESLVMGNGGEVPSRADVAGAVRAINYDGLTGNITFDVIGDRTTATYYVLEVGTADPATWGDNAVISTVDLLSPTTAMNMEMSEAMDTQGKTIAELVVEAATAADGAEFTTLLAAVSAADPVVLENLSNPDAQYTVFAPTDAAFAAVPAETLAAVLADQELLTQILMYHVVDGAVLSTELTSMMADTMLGAQLDIVVSDSGVTVNGANVIIADIVAKNGVIHVIDAVLLPPSN
jgi:branched-chain amino acid transport system substrate-binding protein